jgi:fatty acid desaturase
MGALLAGAAWFWTAVVPNLIASALWGLPALYVHHRRLKAHHRRLIDELRDDLLGAGTEDR